MGVPRGSGTAGLAAMIISASALVTAPDAGAAPADPTAVARLRDGVVYNEPSGSSAKRNRIETHWRKLINRTPRGSVIRVALFFLRDGAVIKDLVRARRRGVHVKVLVDYRHVYQPPGSKRMNPGITRLRKALGTNPRARSYVRWCSPDAACIGTRGTPVQHNKFFLFSRTSGAKKVVVQGTGNISLNTRATNWNSAVTLTGNTKLYRAYRRYFDDLVAMRKNRDYYRVATTGAVKAHYYPRAGHKNRTDTIWRVLDNVQCRGNKRVGTRKTHRTIVRVNMSKLNRRGVARKLRSLDARGCYVTIVYRALSRDTDKILYRPAHGKFHGPSLRCTQYKYKGPGGKTWPAFTHDKYLLIEGGYYGKRDQKVVLFGSPNLTYSALRENDEALLRIDQPGLYRQFLRGYRDLRSELAARKAPRRCEPRDDLRPNVPEWWDELRAELED